MTTRKELVEALRERYRSAAFGERVKILDEFVALTGYHRKTGSASAVRQWARPYGEVFRCAPLPTGAIRRPASSRSTWSSTAAARRRMATTFIR